MPGEAVAEGGGGDGDDGRYRPGGRELPSAAGCRRWWREPARQEPGGQPSAGVPARTPATAAFGRHDAGRHWGGTGRMAGHGGRPFLLLLYSPLNTKRGVLAASAKNPFFVSPPQICMGAIRKKQTTCRSEATSFRRRISDCHDEQVLLFGMAIARRRLLRQGLQPCPKGSRRIRRPSVQRAAESPARNAGTPTGAFRRALKRPQG
jgi:hypothetical protein